MSTAVFALVGISFGELAITVAIGQVRRRQGRVAQTLQFTGIDLVLESILQNPAIRS